MADALYGRPQNVPYDITARQATIAQKKKLAELMAAQAMKDVPTLTDAGVYKINNWGGQAAKAITAGFARSNMDAAAKEEEATAADYNKRLGEGTESFLKGMQGYTEPGQKDLPGPSPDLTRDEGGYDSAERKVAPNPIRAVAEAMASGMGPLQSMAAPYATAMGKGGMTEKEFWEYTKDLTPQARALIAKSKGFQVTEDMLDPKSAFHAVGDIGVTEKGGKITGTQVVNPSSTPGPIPGTPGYVGQQDATGKWKEFHGPTAPNTAGETEWEKLGAKGSMGALESRMDIINKSMELMPRTTQIAGLVRDAFTGTGAEMQLKAQKLLQKIGVAPNAAVPASEQLMSVLSEDVMQHTKPLGTGNGFTDKDLAFTVDARAAGVGKDPKTLVTMAAANIAATMNLQEKQVKAIEEIPEHRRKAIPHLIPQNLMTPINPELAAEYQIYKDPATGMWTTHFTDGYKPRGGGSSAVPRAPLESFFR